MFIEPTRLPAVRFAHTYSAERYENRFEHSRETVEVSFVSEGTLTMTQNGAAYTAKKGRYPLHSARSPDRNPRGRLPQPPHGLRRGRLAGIAGRTAAAAADEGRARRGGDPHAHRRVHLPPVSLRKRAGARGGRLSRDPLQN